MEVNSQMTEALEIQVKKKNTELKVKVKEEVASILLETRSRTR